MRIRTQLAFAAAVTGVLCVLLVLAVVFALQRQSQFTEAVRWTQAAVREATGMLALTQDRRTFGEAQTTAQWTKHLDALSKLFQPVPNAELLESDLLVGLRRSLGRISQLVAALEPSHQQPTDETAMRRREALADDLIAGAQTLAEQTYRWSEDVAERRRSVVRQYLNFFIGVSGIFALLVVAICGLVMRRVIDPLASLKKVAAAVREGDLSVRNNIAGRDEIGDLAREFDAMTGALQRQAADIDAANTNLQQEVVRRTESENQMRLITDNLPVLIARVASDQRYLFVNRQYHDVFGLDTHAMVGKLMGEVMSEAADQAIRPYAIKALSGEHVVFEYRLEANGVARDCRCTFVPDMADNGDTRGFFVLNEDISERNAREAAIAAALKEKETLLREVYHRVKNNLQVITSLFNLQVRVLPDGQARDALKESADRVRAMSLVHEKLYRSPNLASVSLKDYVADLCRQLGAAAAADGRGIVLHQDVDSIEVGLEIAVPLGLLLNELISNSLKHAFPNGRKGTIRIMVQEVAERMGVVVVADDGVGLPAGMDVARQQSLGLKLVSTLCTQLGGELSVDSNQGARLGVTFFLASPEKRHPQ